MGTLEGQVHDTRPVQHTASLSPIRPSGWVGVVSLTATLCPFWRLEGQEAWVRAMQLGTGHGEAVATLGDSHTPWPWRASDKISTHCKSAGIRAGTFGPSGGWREERSGLGAESQSLHAPSPALPVPQVLTTLLEDQSAVSRGPAPALWWAAVLCVSCDTCGKEHVAGGAQPMSRAQGQRPLARSTASEAQPCCFIPSIHI